MITNTDNKISDFEYACKFYETEFSQEELWNFLSQGSDLEKQLACLRLNSLTTIEQAKILMNNLTGVDGKIREAVSTKLKQFLENTEYKTFFLRPNFYPVFLDAIIDINGNICRNIIEGLKNIVDDKNFCEYMITEIFTRSFEVCDKIKSFDYKTRKYITNKEIFKLYWYLTALSIFHNLPEQNFKKLIDNVCDIDEYTVREKLAVLVKKYAKSNEMSAKLNKDNNIYVLKALK